jgi:hypothetical protein
MMVILIASPVMASVQVTLPLQGYWRPGRYMPVRVQGEMEAGVIEIGGEGAVASRLPLNGGRVDAILPVLVMSEGAIQWSEGVVNRPLRQLTADQRLVGFTTMDLALAQSLFPGETIVPIELALADPIPGPAVAWETLDAIVIDAPLAEAKRAELVAAGVVVIVRGQATANQPRIVGPRAAAEDLAAFAPVQGWRAEWPAAFRRRIMLSAIIFAIVAVGVSLLRFKYSALVLVGICALATVVMWMSWRNRPAVLVRWGGIVVRSSEMTQEDLWVYQATASGSQSSMPWSGVMHPYFESREDRVAMKAVLMCESDGTPSSFSFQLGPGQKIGFLMRSFSQVAPTQTQHPSTPMELLARRMYLRPGIGIGGTAAPWELPGIRSDDEAWPTLILKVDR